MVRGDHRQANANAIAVFDSAARAKVAAPENFRD
jgi:hypothetical protein